MNTVVYVLYYIDKDGKKTWYGNYNKYPDQKAPIGLQRSVMWLLALDKVAHVEISVEKLEEKER